MTGEVPQIPTIQELDAIGFTVTDPHYLGERGETLCFAQTARESDRSFPEIPDDFSYQGLRSLFGTTEDDVPKIAAAARGVLDWDANHRFCGRCGVKTVIKEQERARTCPSCELTTFPRISPAIIVAVLRGEKLLLANNRRHPGTMYSIIAGFVEPGESLEGTVRREIREEVSIEVNNIRFFGSQPWPFPDSLMVGFVADYAGGEIEVDGQEILHADWFEADGLPTIPPPGSISRRIIDWYMGGWKDRQKKSNPDAP